MIASASYTISSISDGLTTFYRYAENTSNTSAPTSGWGATVPPSKAGYFIWRQEGTALSFEDVSSWVNPVCLTGDAGQKGADGASDQLIIQYTLGTRDTPPATVIIGEESWGLGKDSWIAGQNFWQSTAKDTTSPDEYVWRREMLYYPSTDTYSDWSYTRLSGEQGIQGPAGTPGFLGLYAEVETLHLKGYGADGVLDQSVGYIYAGGERIAVPATSLTLTEEGTGYILFNNTWTDKVVFAKMTPQGNSVGWIAYNNPLATAYSTTNTYVIGKFQKDNTGIHDEVIISPVGCKDFTTAHFMEIIATEDWASFQTWAKALNVTQTFERLAAYDIFTNTLSANEAFTANLKAVNVTTGYGNGTTGGFRFRAMSDRDMDGGNIPVFDVMYNDRKVFKVDIETGKIYFGEHFWYDPSDGAIHTPNDKTVINADGTIYGEQSNFTESVMNGMKIYPIYGQSSTLPTTLTLKENIPYGTEVIVNISVRLDVSGFTDYYVFPCSGKLSSSNLSESIPITQFWEVIPRSMTFNRYAGSVFLYDTGTDYTLKYQFTPYDTPHIDIVYDRASDPMTRASLTVYDVMISGFIGILPN